MRTTAVQPAIDAEIIHRRERIAHDFAVAHGWELSIRRLFGRRTYPAHEPLPRPARTDVLTSGRLGWR